MNDEINNPAHYMLFPDMQAIDVIRASLTAEEFVGYCKGNALKYRLRAGEKGPADKCIAKANWYQAQLRDADSAELVTELVSVMPDNLKNMPRPVKPEKPKYRRESVHGYAVDESGKYIDRKGVRP